MAGTGLGQLGLWLHLRSRRHDDPPLPEIPPGSGPAILVHVSPDAVRAEDQITRALRRARPGLRILRMQADARGDAGDDPALAAMILDRARPRAVLLLGSALPPALLSAARARHLPVALAELRLNAHDLGWGLQASMRRQLLEGAAAVMVADLASLDLARRMGLDPVMTGPVSEIHEPLPCSETERMSMAQQMNGRHAWFAASLPEGEEDAVLAAHQAVLRRAHRALLILSPHDPARLPALARKVEDQGLTLSRRAEDDDLGDEIQVLLTDGPTEMGLWYRLAPVTFMGGTLTGRGDAMRHPFEPAALGSAIIHGPEQGPHATEWRQLTGARATRALRHADDLPQAVADLIQPESIATLATNAWTVSTGGADVALRIAERLSRLMDRPAEIPA